MLQFLHTHMYRYSKNRPNYRRCDIAICSWMVNSIYTKMEILNLKKCHNPKSFFKERKGWGSVPNTFNINNRMSLKGCSIMYSLVEQLIHRSFSQNYYNTSTSLQTFKCFFLTKISTCTDDSQETPKKSLGNTWKDYSL